MDKLKSKPLYFGRRLQTSGRIIILDVAVPPSIEDRLRSLENMTLLLASYLAEMLWSVARETGISDIRPTLVIPGNGGQSVGRLWQDTTCRTTCVHAKRLWYPGSDPIALVGGIDDNRFLMMDETSVLVLDDVISSGQTLRLIHERNSWRTPRAKWHGASWASQMPRKGYPLELYCSILTGVLIENPEGHRVPINSLSTLVENDEIMQSYARRSGYGEQLRSLIRDLRDEVEQ